ncbi:tetratricopeptide repeat protein [Rhizobium laguerreae]
MTNRLEVEELSNGRIRVALRRSGQIRAEAPGKSSAFNPKLGAQELQELRWYLEDYLTAPYAVYEERGRAVQQRMSQWGQALFDAVFGPQKPGHTAYIRACENPAELVLISRSPAFLSLPWELLQDPKRSTPLALTLTAIDRTFDVEAPAAQIPEGDILRVLMVIARPAGLADVGYQMVARPLVERLSAVRGHVDLNVLRPPTIEAFRAALINAAQRGRPYHIVHFDGHGTFGVQTRGTGQQRGYLAFEAEGGGDDLISADQFALIVSQNKVPVVVLNACRSGMVGAGEAAVEAAVATSLIESGAASVVAMGYSVYAVAAAEFMAAFYEKLFAGSTVSEAVTEGRKRLYLRKDRPSPKGPLPLEDWIVPVHYLRSIVAFPQLRQTPLPDRLSLDALLDAMRPGRCDFGSSDDNTRGNLQLAPVGHFVGRDAAFYTLELALKWHRVAVVHGSAGTGKTELAKAFGRWWQATGGVGDPNWVFFHSFEPVIASSGLEEAIRKIGLQLFGLDFIGRTRDSTERQALVLKLLCDQQMLLIWDNFETVHDLPDLTGAASPVDEAEKKKIREFLTTLICEGQSAVIITSRTTEAWLGDVRRIELGGLTTFEASEMADDVLRPYSTARARRQERSFSELLEWIDGHPLSLRLLLPELDKVPATSLLESLKGNKAAPPPGFVGEGRLASLGASLKYSLDHLTPKMRNCLPALALFEGAVDEWVLAQFSREHGCPAAFAEIGQEEWSAILHRLTNIGLLTPLSDLVYGQHVALPSYLMAEWRRVSGSHFDSERTAAERALLAAYSKFGYWLWHHTVRDSAADTAFALLERHRRTINRLLEVALSLKLYSEAQSLFQALNEFWVVRGLRQEAQRWTDRCRSLLEASDGSPPPLESDAGRLWAYMVDNEANRAMQSGELESAYMIFDAITERFEALEDSDFRSINLGWGYHKLGVVCHELGILDAAEKFYYKSLEIKTILGDKSGLASTFHQLGNVASKRRKFGEAENCYCKAIEIKEELGNLPSIAMTYHALGINFEAQNDVDAAARWYNKSLEIKMIIGDRSGLAKTYHQLGNLSRGQGELDNAERWYRQALEIKETLGDRPTLAVTYFELGNLMQLKGDSNSAERWYLKSLESSDNLNDLRSLTQEMLGKLAKERE